MRRFLVRFAIALVLVTVVTSGGVVAGNAIFEREFDKTETVDFGDDVLAPEVEKGEPANFLILGSDSRSELTDPDAPRAFGDVDGERSDTVMVVHVDPESQTGFVVSFPRDTWVDIPGYGEAKLNAAYGLGQEELVVKTLQENFDIEINHYLEVNFDGFREIVDAIGGVPIFFNAPARDRYSELNIPEAGCHVLDGRQALSYARSRYYEAYTEDDGWKQDPRSDLSRIERQQYFMRSLAAYALNRGARNPLTAYELVTGVFDYMKRDSELDLGDIKGLINAFRDLDPASIEMATLPTEGKRIDGQAVQVVREDDAAPLLARLRTFTTPAAELPEPVAPADVRVRVLNGTGVRGRAGDVLDALVAWGFQPAGDAADADRDDYPLTQVRYSPGAVRKALTVAAALGTANVQETREALPAGVDIEVIVGSDWDDLDAPVKSEAAPTTTGPDATDGSAAPESGASTAPTTATTTTTRPVTTSNTAYVPVDPEAGGPLVGCP